MECRRKKKETCRAYLLGTPIVLPHIFACLEMLEDLLDRSLLLLELLHLECLTSSTSLLDQVLMCFFDKLNVLDPQLLTDDVQVTRRVDVTLDVDDLGVVETPHHLKNGVHGANMRQESIAETRTGRRATGQTSNVIDGQIGRDDGFWLVLLHEPVEALVRHDDTGFFGVNGGIGEIGRVAQRALGQSLEEGGFADIGETDLFWVKNRSARGTKAVRGPMHARDLPRGQNGMLTYNPTLEAVARSSQQDLFLLDFFLGRHLLFVFARRHGTGAGKGRGRLI